MEAAASRVRKDSRQEALDIHVGTAADRERRRRRAEALREEELQLRQTGPALARLAAISGGGRGAGKEDITRLPRVYFALSAAYLDRGFWAQAAAHAEVSKWALRPLPPPSSSLLDHLSPPPAPLQVPSGPPLRPLLPPPAPLQAPFGGGGRCAGRGVRPVHFFRPPEGSGWAKCHTRLPCGPNAHPAL
eukprot:1190202-Prorocentrum_minimum.AAC.3